jgi:uroporphyrinogen-III synthase
VKVLITRAEPDAARLARDLAAHGIESLIEPLMTVRFHADSAAIIDGLLPDAQAVLFTSANGLRAFAEATARRDIKAFAVGDATAAAARQAGFADVESAGGNVDGLAALVIAKLTPSDGAVIHAAGTVTVGDLSGQLSAANFIVRRAVLYETVPAERLSDTTRTALQQGEIDAVLFFSPRNAASFVALAADLAPACARLTAIALSPAIANALSPLSWGHIAVAAAPNEAALIAAIQQFRNGKTTMTDAPPPHSVATPQPIVTPAPKKRRRLSGGAIGILAMIVIVVAIAGTAPLWMDYLPASLSGKTNAPAPDNELAQRLDAIEQQLDKLAAINDRLDTVERRRPSDASAAVAPLNDRMQQLDTRLDRIEARLTQMSKDQAAQGDSTERVLLIALAGLGNAVSGSQPFTAQLASVEALGQGRPGWAADLRPLEDAAKSGLPSTALLAQRFTETTAPAILRAEAASPSPEESMWQAVLSKLRGLIVVRRTDTRQGGGTPAAAAVATAEAALDKGDLAGAVHALEPLKDAPGDAAASWLKEAHQRLQTEETIAKLTQTLSADLAASTRG